MRQLVSMLVVAVSVLGCGSAPSASPTTPAPATLRETSNAVESDEALLQRNLDDCFAAADRSPERREIIRPVCLCVISGGTEDAALLRDLRASDEPAMTARAQACATASRLLPFVALDRCLGSRRGDYETCVRFATCVRGQIDRAHSGDEFDAWFTALTPEARRQLGADSAAACSPQLSAPPNDP